MLPTDPVPNPLAFSTPDLGPQGKVFYAAATYTLLVLVYAANNLPYSAGRVVDKADDDEFVLLEVSDFLAAK